ncbi:MAG TPA: hypothetical protein VGE30_00895 [Candidatus Saccharimonadales bacterium]
MSAAQAYYEGLVEIGPQLAPEQSQKLGELTLVPEVLECTPVQAMQRFQEIAARYDKKFTIGQFGHDEQGRFIDREDGRYYLPS